MGTETQALSKFLTFLEFFARNKQKGTKIKPFTVSHNLQPYPGSCRGGSNQLVRCFGIWSLTKLPSRQKGYILFTWNSSLNHIFSLEIPSLCHVMLELLPWYPVNSIDSQELCIAQNQGLNSHGLQGLN